MIDIPDFIFLLLFGLVFTILFYIEAQIASLKAMMEEHTRYDEPLKNGVEKLKRYTHKE